MEVILRAAVENLGHPGDIVNVAPGYGRNYLLPRGLAYAATPGNKKRMEQERQRLEAAESSRRTTAAQLGERLEQVSLTFSARVGDEGKLFGRSQPRTSRTSSRARASRLKSDRSISTSRSARLACIAFRSACMPT